MEGPRADKGHLSGDPEIEKQTALLWQPGESVQGEEQHSPRRKVTKCEGCREPGLRSQEQSDQGAGTAPGGDLEGNLEGWLACAWRVIWRTPGRYLEKYLQGACWLQTWPERAQPIPLLAKLPASSCLGWGGLGRRSWQATVPLPHPRRTLLEPGTLWLP